MNRRTWIWTTLLGRGVQPHRCEVILCLVSSSGHGLFSSTDICLVALRWLLTSLHLSVINARMIS